MREFHYQKLPVKLQARVDEKINKFRKNPLDPTLKNHPLKGSMQGKRSFSVTGDMRIIFKEFDGYVVVLMLDVGTHAQMYGL